jgi:hypothetical protein
MRRTPWKGSVSVQAPDGSTIRDFYAVDLHEPEADVRDFQRPDLNSLQLARQAGWQDSFDYNNR